MSYKIKSIIKEHSLDELHSEPFVNHRRLRVFAAKGTTCVACGKVGTKLLTCETTSFNQVHTDVFADDGTMITIDHIIPKSKGGKNLLENLVPMCAPCNSRKSDFTEIPLSKKKKVRTGITAEQIEIALASGASWFTVTKGEDTRRVLGSSLEQVSKRFKNWLVKQNN